MRREAASVLAFLGVFAFAAGDATVEARGKVPALLARARYVALGYDTPRGFLSKRDAMASADVLAAERDLLEGIREQIEEWGHYVIVDDRRDAEILMSVRLGRLATIGGGGIVGSGAAGRAGGGFASVEISSPYDLLLVSDSSGTVLWRVQRKGGLSGTPPAAFAEFKADVERAAKK